MRHRNAVPDVAVSAADAGVDRQGPPRRRDGAIVVAGGETNMFTGVMCGSYHDVWMELHEDLLQLQGIAREEEGSF